MRWLMIALLVSLGLLLLAVAAMARHIRLHRKQLKEQPQTEAEAVEAVLEAGERTGLES